MAQVGRQAEMRKGRAASPGLASGPVVALEATAIRAEATTVRPADPAAELARLAQALEDASAQLSVLIERVDEDAAEMLEFQLAMIEDEELSAPAVAAITGGTAAPVAFEAALDAAIAGYLASDDDYFRARSADLVDIRNRVLRLLSAPGAAEGSQDPKGAILAGVDITPSRFLETDWSEGGGIALAEGSPSSHVAMLARARGVPMVVGLGPAANGDAVMATIGALARNPAPAGGVRFDVQTLQQRIRAGASLGHDVTFVSGEVHDTVSWSTVLRDAERLAAGGGKISRARIVAGIAQINHGWGAQTLVGVTVTAAGAGIFDAALSDKVQGDQTEALTRRVILQSAVNNDLCNHRAGIIHHGQIAHPARHHGRAAVGVTGIPRRPRRIKAEAHPANLREAARRGPNISTRHAMLDDVGQLRPGHAQGDQTVVETQGGFQVQLRNPTLRLAG